MFYDPAFVKTVSIIALVVFILMMVSGILITVAGSILMDSHDGVVDTAIQDVSSDDPGAGWLFLGRLFGGLISNFLLAIIIVIGFSLIGSSLIVYFPAFIAFIVYRKTKNLTAYWILMGIWFALLLICILSFVFG